MLVEKKGIGHLNVHIWLLMDDGDALISYYWFILLLNEAVAIAFTLASFGNYINFVLVLNEQFIKHCEKNPEVSVSSLHFYFS